jgi:hypothetical protein
MAEGSAVNAPPAGAAPSARRIPVRLLLFGLVAVAAFGVGFLAFDVNQARVFVKQYGYYTIAVTFAWAVLAWVRLARASTASRLTRREWLQMVAVIAACTVVVLFTTPFGYKILFDEMVLQSTALDMHIYREVSTVVRAYHVDGVFAPLDTYVDKRPFFFPFLVSLVHDVTGYREANAFWLNAALLAVILGTIYAIARRLASHAAALVAAVSLGTLSTLAQSGTSAGMETLNLAMMLITLFCAVLYLEQPDEIRLSAMILSAVLLAQSRYESSLFIFPVAVVALEGWRRSGRLILPAAAILAPALLIPYAVHNTYLSGTPSLWELRENVQTRFGFQHARENLVHAAGFFFNTTRDLTNSQWLSAAGAVALAWAALRLWRARRRWRAAPPAALAVPLFATAILGNLAILMFYYWGQLDDPTVSRLSLPICALGALAIASVLPAFGQRAEIAGWVCAGGAVVAYLATGIIANPQHSRRNTLATELAWEVAYLESLPPGERLIVTNKSALPWMIRHVPAISVDAARRRVAQLEVQLQSRNFRDLIVAQKYVPTSAVGDFQLDPADRLPDWFELEPLAEKRFGGHLDRLSRLVAIRPHASAAK